MTIFLDNDMYLYVEDLEEITKHYNKGDLVIAWQKVWHQTNNSYKKHPYLAEILGVYNRIIRTDVGDYTAWDLIDAERAFKEGGFDNYVE